MAFAPIAAAGASVVGSVLGGKSQKKAAKKAAQITAADNAQNRAFATDMYNRSSAAFAPYERTGSTANGAIMELLGFGPQQQPGAFSQPTVFSQPSIPPYANSLDGNQGRAFNDTFDGQSGGYPGYAAPQIAGQAPVDGVTAAAPSARSAFDTYRQSTGYDFRMGEGTRALQSAFSRNLDSGAAQKAAIRYGQGQASDEFSRYMQLLSQQQQLGFGAASAQAGVGQNFTNTVISGNQAAATAAANARLYAGNASANMWSGIGSSFGQLAGAFGK